MTHNTDDLSTKLQQARAEREQIQQSNNQLQHNLVKYFIKQGGKKTANESLPSDEQRYLGLLGQLEDLQQQIIQKRADDHVRNFISHCDERLRRTEEGRKKFIEFKKQVAYYAINRSGRPIPPKDIDIYLSAEMRKDAEVVNLRIENIKLKNNYKKVKHRFKPKDEPKETLNLVDFVQMKIDNHAHNEKAEARHLEIRKLHMKNSMTVEAITYLKANFNMYKTRSGAEQILQDADALHDRKEIYKCVQDGHAMRSG